MTWFILYTVMWPGWGSKLTDPGLEIRNLPHYLMHYWVWRSEIHMKTVKIHMKTVKMHKTVKINIWTASSKFGTYRLCGQRRFRRACASAQSRQNLCCSLIQAVSQEEPSERKPDPWPLWMAGHAPLKVCHDDMLKDTNSLDGAHMKTVKIHIPLTKSGIEWSSKFCNVVS